MNNSFSENKVIFPPSVPTPILWRKIADSDDDLPSPRFSVAKRAWRLLDKWGGKIIITAFIAYALIRIISIINL
jgi:hypothetical protein